ncbi:MAG TPA: hypothetical protein VNZ49_15935 [Bacteroidia bacterium]|nr:hypothetical protein [Bacteroidia bacterium]
MENKDINNEIEKTLNSLDNLQKTEVSSFLYDKIIIRLQNKEAKIVSIAPRLVWQAAACFAVLITLNVFVWTRSANTTETKTQTGNNNPVAKEYFSYLNTTQF